MERCVCVACANHPFFPSIAFMIEQIIELCIILVHEVRQHQRHRMVLREETIEDAKMNNKKVQWVCKMEARQFLKKDCACPGAPYALCHATSGGACVGLQSESSSTILMSPLPIIQQMVVPSLICQ